MFYRMIERARDRWFGSEDCTVRDLVKYMEARGQMRDAQVEAIKTYLYLKIACGCKPLSVLFSEGYFNCLNIGELALPDSIKGYFKSHPDAAAVYEYATLKNEKDQQVSAELEKLLSTAPETVDCVGFFRSAFYNVTYTDYLFSLPMGAGKTYLMAAFIYLDLYFAMNEPKNPAFAHNFIILAPSGLKSSVVPSLRTIQNFDPSWVLPEPSASAIQRQLSFEVLDQEKTAKKSNKTKNPNVQKIANHQPLTELFGLVAVTNAEKVIFDRIEEKNGQLNMFEDSEDDKDRQANELRNLIGKLPSLSVFIDEVHHAVSDEIKLRAVVSRWAENGTVNSVVGFSGTPYLEKPEKNAVTDRLSVSTAEITNIVYYYPLIAGVGNFLKRPVVKIADMADSARIIENGVREFLDTYKNTVYHDGTTAKLGIYCGTIEKLEQLVYPLVSSIVSEYGLPHDVILRFHKGNKQYPQPADSQMQFDILDKPISRTRIVLLVQIGKEGWDCKSLTGIILSQEGDCPRNMVLQTSCRCLRQVDKDTPETALITLNADNGEKLKAQLEEQHHITLREFTEAGGGKKTLIRYDRTKYLRLPKVEFYQLCVSFNTVTAQPADPEQDIAAAAQGAKLGLETITTTDLTMKPQMKEFNDAERGETPAEFTRWLYEIARSSIETVTMSDLRIYHGALKKVFDTITYERDGKRYFSSKYDRRLVEANIRKSFSEKRSFETVEELIPEKASLLNIAHFSSEIKTDTPDAYYPKQDVVESIHQADVGKPRADKKLLQLMKLAEETGQTAILEQLRLQTASHPQKDKSFHYLPYRTDSGFERRFMDDLLPYLDDPKIKPLNLELYYNGDRTLTEFQIKCYKSVNGHWRYIGLYTPDFLILQRRDGKIHKVIIVETKGEGYAGAQSFKDRRTFMEAEFIRKNNEKFGYERFEYLYLEDSVPEGERLHMVREKIIGFFEEVKE